MKLRLIREPSLQDTTHGSLYVNNHWYCWTIEDRIREVVGVLPAVWKVAGATAIPAGVYRIALTQSARFGRMMPILIDVPGFEGIRIHPGNTPADTEGCILVGKVRGEASVGMSRAAYDPLFDWMQSVTLDDEGIAIAIENPPAESPSLPTRSRTTRT